MVGDSDGEPRRTGVKVAITLVLTAEGDAAPVLCCMEGRLALAAGFVADTKPKQDKTMGVPGFSGDTHCCGAGREGTDAGSDG